MGFLTTVVITLGVAAGVVVLLGRIMLSIAAFQTSASRKASAFVLSLVGIAAALPLAGCQRQQKQALREPSRAPATRPTRRPAVPPPTAAPSPTSYIPAFVNYTPPPRARAYMPTPEREEKFVLTVDTAAKRIGWTMHVTTVDGREFEGVLLAADEHSLTFQRQLGGGSMVFPLPKSDIRKLELKQ